MSQASKSRVLPVDSFIGVLCRAQKTMAMEIHGHRVVRGVAVRVGQLACYQLNFWPNRMPIERGRLVTVRVSRREA
jgi:hypothetical protein